MEENQIKKLLASIAQGEISAEDGYKKLRNYPFESVEGFAVLDHQREMRTGFPEVIFGQGKIGRAHV
jgi:NCAIR mutase (PurE)-related protein